ncbi:hypothetical protein Dimus_015752 [Dionaea muscipula]
MVSFPRLFSIATNQNATVADYLSTGLQVTSWQEVFRHPLRAWQEELWLALLDRLQRADVQCRLDFDDRIIWATETHGVFTVRSLYMHSLCPWEQRIPVFRLFGQTWRLHEQTSSAGWLGNKGAAGEKAVQGLLACHSQCCHVEHLKVATFGGLVRWGPSGYGAVPSPSFQWWRCFDFHLVRSGSSFRAPHISLLIGFRGGLAAVQWICNGLGILDMFWFAMPAPGISFSFHELQDFGLLKVLWSCNDLGILDLFWFSLPPLEGGQIHAL